MTSQISRFAPSPSGYLHLGHVYSAWRGWQRARRSGGRFLLRIEDIDIGRSRPEYERAISVDLAWLGIDWDGPVRRQSDHLPTYQAGLDRLRADGLIYPCFCTRRDVADALRCLPDPPMGPDGPLYPGTCRTLSAAERNDRLAAGHACAWRLDSAAAAARVGPLVWTDLTAGDHVAQVEILGDLVLGRRDIVGSYHLSVVLDDIAQGVTHVTRGMDLFAYSHVHRLLYALFEAPAPVWDHHPLIVDGDGRRLSKTARSEAIRTLREAGASPTEIWSRIGVTPLAAS